MAGIADLIIASGQLAAVDSVIKAIRKADKEAGANSTSQPPTNRAAVTEYYRPADYYEPQRVITPAAAYSARPVIHTGSSSHSVPVEKQPAVYEVNVIVVQPTLVANEQPLQPPWAVLPWENPVQTAQKVKVVYRPPDINHRAGGTEYRATALDLFI